MTTHTHECADCGYSIPCTGDCDNIICDCSEYSIDRYFADLAALRKASNCVHDCGSGDECFC